MLIAKIVDWACLHGHKVEFNQLLGVFCWIWTWPNHVMLEGGGSFDSSFGLFYSGFCK